MPNRGKNTNIKYENIVNTNIATVGSHRLVIQTDTTPLYLEAKTPNTKYKK